MSAGLLVVVMVSAILIVVMVAGLIAEHRRNKRHDTAGEAGSLLVRLSAQCNARPNP